MRGRIIQYNGADGTGTVVVEGRQLRFALAAWQGDAVPAAGQVAEVALEADAVRTIAVVPEAVLLKEQVARVGGQVQALARGQLGALAQKMGAVAAAAAAGSDARAGADAGASAGATSAAASVTAMAGAGVVARYGWVLLAAYAAYVLGTLVFDAVKVSMFGDSHGASLFDIGSMMNQMRLNGGGGIKLLMLLAYASVLAPLLMPASRNAWLGLVVPLVALVWAVVRVLHTVGHAMGPVMDGEMGRMFSDAFSTGIGLYLAAAAGVVLAVGGLWRWLKAA